MTALLEYFDQMLPFIITHLTWSLGVYKVDTAWQQVVAQLDQTSPMVLGPLVSSDNNSIQQQIQMNVLLEYFDKIIKHLTIGGIWGSEWHGR